MLSSPGPSAGPVDRFLSLVELEPLARQRMSEMAFEYVAGGVGDEITLQDNEAAFGRLRLRPRALVDVSRLDTTVDLFGVTLPFPILLAPTGYHRLMHPEGELATVEGANRADATLVASSFATCCIEDMARRSRRPLWFQLYVVPDRAFTRDLVRRVEAAGCAALCVTVDVPSNGPRYRELRAGFALPEGVVRANLAGLGSSIAGAAHRSYGRDIYSGVRDPALTWDGIDWLRSLTRLPLLLKGILTRDDARRAAGHGVDGLVCSNHGGRSLDGLPATIDALPEVVEGAGTLPVLLDGGVRRGTDVFKALALGARAVLIGRPYLYGLALDGPDGVARVVEILRTELEMAMALAGRPCLADITAAALWDARRQ